MLASSAQKNTGPTAGPWRVEDVGFPPGHLAIMAGSSTEYRWVASVSEDRESGIDWTQTQANARLIAAAPDLLYACLILVRLIGIVQPKADQPNEVRVALAAIAKTEGRTP